MDLKEAIAILDPETREEALRPYALDGQMRSVVTEGACRDVCAWVRKKSVKSRWARVSWGGMFCYRCGGAADKPYRYCPSCGREMEEWE